MKHGLFPFNTSAPGSTLEHWHCQPFGFLLLFAPSADCFINELSAGKILRSFKSQYPKHSDFRSWKNNAVTLNDAIFSTPRAESTGPTIFSPCRSKQTFCRVLLDSAIQQILPSSASQKFLLPKRLGDRTPYVSVLTVQHLCIGSTIWSILFDPRSLFLVEEIAKHFAV